MRPYNWSYTQFSQFNSDDSLLLVSGVFVGPHNSSSGEIAVISMGNYHPRLHWGCLGWDMVGPGVPFLSGHVVALTSACPASYRLCKGVLSAVPWGRPSG